MTSDLTLHQAVCIDRWSRWWIGNSSLMLERNKRSGGWRVMWATPRAADWLMDTGLHGAWFGTRAEALTAVEAATVVHPLPEDMGVIAPPPRKTQSGYEIRVPGGPTYRATRRTIKPGWSVQRSDSRQTLHVSTLWKMRVEVSALHPRAWEDQ